MRSQSKLWDIVGRPLQKQKSTTRTADELKLVLGFPLLKGRKYIDSPSDAPKGTKIQQGPRGGYYYEDAGEAEQKPDISEFKQKLSGMDDNTLKSQIGIIENEYPEVKDVFQNWYDNKNMGILDGQLSVLFGMPEDSSRAGKIDLDPKTAEGFMKIYSVTQEYLNRTEPNGSSIIQRGLGPHTYKKFKHLEAGEDIDIVQYNISSWTNDYDMALEFAKLDEAGGILIETVMPNKKVFLHPGCSSESSNRYAEGEVLVMGPKIDAVVGEIFEPEYDEEDEDYE